MNTFIDFSGCCIAVPFFFIAAYLTADVAVSGRSYVQLESLCLSFAIILSFLHCCLPNGLLPSGLSLTASPWICLHIRTVLLVPQMKQTKSKPAIGLLVEAKLEDTRRRDCTKRVTVKQQCKQHWTRSTVSCLLFVGLTLPIAFSCRPSSPRILLLVYLSSLAKLNLASILTLTLGRSIFMRSL